MKIDIEESGKDILRTVWAVRQHRLNCPTYQISESGLENLKERIDQALWNLKKFETTKYLEYFDTAVDILREVRES